jgi:THO complex subunit 5
MEVDTVTDSSSFDISSQLRTAHNARLYAENQRLSSLISSLIEYQLANPSVSNPTSRGDIDHAKEVEQEIELRKKRIRAQLAVIKTLYRQSVLKVREEKSMTSEGRAVNDALILQLHNLKYEEQSLEREIGAAEGYE